jgi:hypothetical protein
MSDDVAIMSVEAFRPSFWDDELERLTTEAASLLGEEAVIAALGNTFAKFRHDHDGGTVSFQVFTDGLKAELRRIVRPH